MVATEGMMVTESSTYKVKFFLKQEGHDSGSIPILCIKCCYSVQEFTMTVTWHSVYTMEHKHHYWNMTHHDH